MKIRLEVISVTSNNDSDKSVRRLKIHTMAWNDRVSERNLSPATQWWDAPAGRQLARLSCAAVCIGPRLTMKYTMRISLKIKTNYTDLSHFDGYSDFKYSSFEFNMEEKVTLRTKLYFTVGNISNHLFFTNYWLCTCYYTYCSSEN